MNLDTYLTHPLIIPLFMLTLTSSLLLGAELNLFCTFDHKRFVGKFQKYMKMFLLILFVIFNFVNMLI